MKETKGPLRGTNILIVELGRTTFSERDGFYEFRNVKPGKYHVIAHLDHIFTESAKIVSVEAGAEISLDFVLSVTGEKHEITVTASEAHSTTFGSFQDVESFDASVLVRSNAVSLGEALDHQVGAGITKRGFGPGSARPIIRGFDGDRVLILEDGLRTGALSSQAGGDHGEAINAAQLEQLKIVKGPATLLYSGNAMGGTVNAISRHHEHHRHPHQGLRGYILGSGGTTNALSGSSGGFEYGIGKWMIWGQGGGIRTGDYTAPQQGKIFNSHANMSNIGGGFGWYSDKIFFGVDTTMDLVKYGAPFAEILHHQDPNEEETHGHEEEDHHHDEIERITSRANRESYRVYSGVHNLQKSIESFVINLRYVNWDQDEIESFEDGSLGSATYLSNKQLLYRGVFEQKRGDFLSGRFGFWGISRDYTTGENTVLVPPVDQNGFAVFALEELQFERFKLQFGGRLEVQHYRPLFTEHSENELDHHYEYDNHEEEIHDVIERDFVGGSVAIGLHTDFWKDGALVVNYASSYRPPALEELYNHGLHTGSAAFEVGNSNLMAERGNGVDGSLRYGRGRIRGEFNLFYYHLDNFIFPFVTGDQIDGFREVKFTQLVARFTGTEANLSLGVHRDFWLKFGMDYVNAREMSMDTPLPRIPPLRGKVGVEYRKKGFHFEPELILASKQSRTFNRETTTPGYVVGNLKASYTYAQRRRAHQFLVSVFNVGNRLYRNHTSFIKDLAPEIGRGVRFTYMVRFF